MSTHIYAFGSICRGEYEPNSDVDLLVCTSDDDGTYDKGKFSIYDYPRINELWLEGNPFAWHLFYESKIIYASNGVDFIKTLGTPSEYVNGRKDCLKFRELFEEAIKQLESDSTSQTFHLSCIFLAIRNFATCYSLHRLQPIFSRKSPFLIEPKLQLNEDVYNVLLNARILSTRGVGKRLSRGEIETVKDNVDVIGLWMDLVFGVLENE